MFLEFTSFLYLYHFVELNSNFLKLLEIFSRALKSLFGFISQSISSIFLIIFKILEIFLWLKNLIKYLSDFLLTENKTMPPLKPLQSIARR